MAETPNERTRQLLAELQNRLSRYPKLARADDRNTRGVFWNTEGNVTETIDTAGTEIPTTERVRRDLKSLRNKEENIRLTYIYQPRSKKVKLAKSEFDVQKQIAVWIALENGKWTVGTSQTLTNINENARTRDKRLEWAEQNTAGNTKRWARIEWTDLPEQDDGGRDHSYWEVEEEGAEGLFGMYWLMQGKAGWRAAHGEPGTGVRNRVTFGDGVDRQSIRISPIPYLRVQTTQWKNNDKGNVTVAQKIAETDEEETAIDLVTVALRELRWRTYGNELDSEAKRQKLLQDQGDIGWLRMTIIAVLAFGPGVATEIGIESIMALAGISLMPLAMKQGRYNWKAMLAIGFGLTVGLISRYCWMTWLST